MVRLFQSVLQMSISACYVIAVVMVLRFILRKCPKKYSYVLWSAVGFRLCCPYSLPSVISLFNLSFNRNGSTVVDLSEVTEIIGSSGSGSVKVGMPAVSESLDQMLIGSSGTLSPVEGDLVPFVPAEAPVPAVTQSLSIDPMAVLAVVWAIGVSILLIYSFIAYFRVKREVSLSLPVRGNIRKAEIRTPFILGFIRPVIYIPFGLEPAVENIAVSHERHHIKRGDHFVKAFAFVLLCLHWMNPLVWVAYFEMVKDMEMSCDEYVLAHYRDITKSYSMALLSFSVGRQFSLSSPLAFGECSVKERIKNAMKYKIAKKSVSVLAAILCIVALVSCATNGSKEEIPGGPSGETDNNIPQENTPQEEIIEYTTPTVVYMSSILSNKGSDGCVYTEMHPYPGLENVLEDRLPGENFVYIIKIDPSAKSMKVNCDVPGCKHNDASCPGIIRYANSSMMFTAPDGSSIYVISCGAPDGEATEDSQCGTITKMDLDGKNREAIVRLGRNERFENNDRVYMDDEHLYASVITYDETTGKRMKTLNSFDLSSGSGEVLYEYVYLAETEEHLKCMVSSNELITEDYSTKTYYRVTLSSGEKEQFMQSINPVLFTNTDMIVLHAHGEGAGLTVSDYRTGETKEIPVPQIPRNGDAANNLYSIRELPDSWILIDENIDAEAENYLVNTETGEVMVAALRANMGISGPNGIPGIIASLEDEYLIGRKVWGDQFKWHFYDKNGNVVYPNSETEGPGYSLIRKEDYIQGNPDITGIEYILD